MWSHGDLSGIHGGPNILSPIRSFASTVNYTSYEHHSRSPFTDLNDEQAIQELPPREFILYGH